MTPDSGVPLDVATRRAANVSALRYELALSIPDTLASPLTGTETIRFELKDATSPLVIDFETSRDNVKSVDANGKPAAFQYVNGHIVIPAASLVSATFGSSIRIVVSASLLSASCAWYPQMRVWLLNRARFSFDDDLDDAAPFRSVSSEYTYDGTHTPGATFTRQPSMWNDNVRLSRPDNSSSVPALTPLKRTSV